MDHQSGAKDSLPQLKAPGTRRSLLWSLAIPTCVAVAVLIAAIGAYTARAVIQGDGRGHPHASRQDELDGRKGAESFTTFPA